MKIQVPAPVCRLIDELERSGHQAWAVGGCVRDSLMGRPPKDWDLCTDAHPEAVIALFSPHRRVIDTAKRHGTVVVAEGGENYEITTYRTDGQYTDGRRPDSVSFSPDIREDLRRRDFTMNAIAYHPERGLCDPYGGRADIEKGLIRCVGDPAERFGEDHLRILRALRFAAELGFALDEATDRAAEALADRLDRVAPERQFAELRKALSSGKAIAPILRSHPRAAAAWLPAASELPGFPRAEIDRVGGDFTLRLALVLSGDQTGGAAELEMRRFKASRQLIREVPQLVRAMSQPIAPVEAQAARAVGGLGGEQADRLARAHLAMGTPQADAFARCVRRAQEEKWCVTIGDLALNGRELGQIEGVSGAQIGALLARLLDEVIEGRVENTKNALRERALLWK